MSLRSDLERELGALTGELGDAVRLIQRSPLLRLSVSVNVAPTVSLTTPLLGAVFSAPAAVRLTAVPTVGVGRTISAIKFFRDGIQIASVAGPLWTFDDLGQDLDHHNTGLPEGDYSYQAEIVDSGSATARSATVFISVISSVNVALLTQGSTATASTTIVIGGVDFSPNSALKGDRSGANWGHAGGWNNATVNDFGNTYHDTHLAASQLIREIVVVTLQDSWLTAGQPNDSTLFTQEGATVYDVHYSNAGGPFIPLLHIDNSARKVISRVPVSPSIHMDTIRVYVRNALDGYARLVSVEAYSDGVPAHIAPVISVTSPANNARLTIPAAVQLSAIVTAFGAVINLVEIYRLDQGGVLISLSAPTAGTRQSGTWSGVDNIATVGNYSYYWKAYDSLGTNTTSGFTTIAVNDIPPPPPPPAQGYIDLPLKVFVAYQMPTKDYGPTSGKHSTVGWDAQYDDLFWIAGDYDNVGYGNGYVQLVWALDLLARAKAGNGHPEAGWSKLHPYEGYGGTSLTLKHPDYITASFDSRRNLWWTMPGTFVPQGITTAYPAGSLDPTGAPGEYVGNQSDPNFRVNELMTFDRNVPGPLRYKRYPNTGIAPHRNTTNDNSWMGYYDSVTDKLFQPNSTPFAMFWDVLDCSKAINDDPTAWEAGFSSPEGASLYGKEYLSVDKKRREIYVIDGVHSWMWSLHMDTRVFRFHGYTPWADSPWGKRGVHLLNGFGVVAGDPPVYGENYAFHWIDEVGDVLLHMKTDEYIYNPTVANNLGFDPQRLYAYHLPNGPWEEVPIVVTGQVGGGAGGRPGIIGGRVFSHHPTQNAGFICGGVEDYIDNNFYLFRWAEPPLAAWLNGVPKNQWTVIPNSVMSAQDHSYLASLGITLTNSALHYPNNKYGVGAGAAEGVSIGSSTGTTTYGSVSFDMGGGRLWTGGGDTSRGDAAMHQFNFAQDTPAWTMNVVHSANASQFKNVIQPRTNPDTYPPLAGGDDGRRFRTYDSRRQGCHSYFSPQYFPDLNAVCFFGQQNGWNNDQGTDPEVHVGYLGTQVWDPGIGTPFPPVPHWVNDFNPWGQEHPVTYDRYVWSSIGILSKMTAATRTWSDFLYTGDNDHWLSGSIDWTNQYILFIGINRNNNQLVTWMTPLTNPVKTPVTITALPGEDITLLTLIGRTGGLAYCPDITSHLWYNDTGIMYRIQKTGATTFSFSTYGLLGTPPPAGLRGDNQMLGNMRYISNSRCKGMVVRFYDSLPIWFFRTA